MSQTRIGMVLFSRLTQLDLRRRRHSTASSCPVGRVTAGIDLDPRIVTRAAQRLGLG